MAPQGARHATVGTKGKVEGQLLSFQGSRGTPQSKPLPNASQAHSIDESVRRNRLPPPIRHAGEGAAGTAMAAGRCLFSLREMT